MKEKHYPYSKSLPLYRHKELYAWSDKYQAHKFFTDNDYKEYIRLEHLRYKGILDYVENKGDELLEYEEPYEYKYSERYNSLKQDTIFFKNLKKIEDIRWHASGYSDFILKCLVQGISERKANFEILYTFFCPGRIFSYDYKTWTAEELAEHWARWKRSADDIGMQHDYKQWCKFEQMRKDAFRGKKHNCATYKEFIECEL